MIIQKEGTKDKSKNRGRQPAKANRWKVAVNREGGLQRLDAPILLCTPNAIYGSGLPEISAGWVGGKKYKTMQGPEGGRTAIINQSQPFLEPPSGIICQSKFTVHCAVFMYYLFVYVHVYVLQKTAYPQSDVYSALKK